MKRLLILFVFLVVLVGWFVYTTSKDNEAGKVTIEQVDESQGDSLLVDSTTIEYKD